MIKTAVMLVGGEGERLKPYTHDRPKPLVEVGGREILAWNLDWLKGSGIENIVFACGPKREKIEEFMKQHAFFGLNNVHFSENSKDGGTAEAFKKAIDSFVKDENYLAMNGDELTNLSLRNLIRIHESTSPYLTMALAPFYCPFSVVNLTEDGKSVTHFEYGKILEKVPVSMGVYLFNSRINSRIPSSGSIENQLFTKLAEEGNVAAYMLSNGEEWATVNTAKDIKLAKQKLIQWGRLKDSNEDSK